MAVYLLQDYMRKTDVVEDFKSFIAHDGVLSIASAVIIGISSVTFITCLVKDVILPLLYLITFKWITWISPNIESGVATVYGNTKFNFIGVFQGVITWIMALIVTFYILEFFVRRTLLKKKKGLEGYKDHDSQHH